MRDLSDGEHDEEVLDLLQLGIGGVTADRTIWLVKPFVDVVYAASDDKGPLLELLRALVMGARDAIHANRVPADIHLRKVEDQDLDRLTLLDAEIQKLQIEK
jgi:hypothetical protein